MGGRRRAPTRIAVFRPPPSKSSRHGPISVRAGAASHRGGMRRVGGPSPTPVPGPELRPLSDARYAAASRAAEARRISAAG